MPVPEPGGSLWRVSHASVWQRVLRLLGVVPADGAHECMYGKTPGALGNCSIVVPPHQGWREAGMVFCSDEHAALDQEEQAF